MNKLLSRKLWVAISSASAIVIAAVSKELAWAEAASSLVAIAIGYCASQGWVDAKEIEHAIAEQVPVAELAEAPVASEPNAE